MKKLVMFLIVLVSLMTLISPVSAESPLKDAAEIKGPTALYLGKSYKFQVSCTDIGTNYMEFGFLPKISKPKVIKGGGILSYDLEEFPGFLSWRGDPADKLILQFTVTPTSIGEYTVNLECWGQEVFEVGSIHVTVVDRR